MLTIRFARVGKRNQAQFKIMLQENTVAPGGRHIEVLGSYNPHKKETVLKEERIQYWLSKGVKMSDTVHNLFVAKGLVKAEKKKVKIPAKPAPEAPAEEAKTEEAPKEEKTEEGAKEEVKAE